MAQREIPGVAPWLIENRERILGQACRTVEVKAEFAGRSDNHANKKGHHALPGPETPSKEE